MKQLTVISGKGGTGKTSIVASFGSLAKDTIFADCDVDATDLHLIFKPEIKKKIIFKGLKIPEIDREKCINCGKCKEACRFDAIDENIKVHRESCEGCGVCEFVCPVNAIKMVDRNSGYVYISETRFGILVHANLGVGEEGSGKLITKVRENAKNSAGEEDLIVVDGSPGIGCPVISSVTGVDLALVVVEPTLSSIYDLERVVEVTKYFNVPAVVCINKYDINLKNTLRIDKYCQENNLKVVGKIPYDNVVTEAMIQGKNVIEYSEGEVSEEIKKMWNKIKNILG